MSWNDRERLVVNCDGVYSPRDIYTHPILVINLCLELGFTSFLPAAFYDLSRYGPSKIAESVLSSSECDEGSWPSVSGDVLLAVLEGRERGQKYVTHYVATELCKRAPSPFCTNAGDDYSRLCHESFYFIMLNILRCVGGLSNGRDADPLFTILQSVEMMSREDFINDQGKFRLGLCGPCKADFTLAAGRAREEVWRRMPVWFGLEEPFDEEKLVLDINLVYTDAEVELEEDETM